MWYIWELSNKFDLNQTTRVSHNVFLFIFKLGNNRGYSKNIDSLGYIKYRHGFIA